jgi:2TM family of unknown function (DUF5676)
MKLNANRLFVAVALSVALVWLVCALLVGVAPGGMRTMSGHMMHNGSYAMGWSMNPAGILVGLFVWSLSAGALAWLVATIYNFLGRNDA